MRGFLPVNIIPACVQGLFESRLMTWYLSYVCDLSGIMILMDLQKYQYMTQNFMKNPGTPPHFRECTVFVL